MSWWWLSFSDERFLGAAIVEASNFPEAVLRTHALGINPGGEVLALGPFSEDEVRPLVGPGCCNRLLSKREIMEELGGMELTQEMIDSLGGIQETSASDSPASRPTRSG
jgi:hypothetical protein